MKTTTPRFPVQFYARLAAVLYITVIAAGIIAQMFISESIIVWGDAAATAANIQVQKSLYQLGFTIYLIEMSAQIAQFVAFYVVLRPVKPSAALLPQPIRLAYHDACHLAHAQGVRAAPRRLLAAIPNVSLVEIPEAELCCGSAGTYNLEQPDIAATLAQRKAENILSTGCEAVAAGNIGCLVQVANAMKQMGKAVPVLHTLMVLDQAYQAG